VSTTAFQYLQFFVRDGISFKQLVLHVNSCIPFVVDRDNSTVESDLLWLGMLILTTLDLREKFVPPFWHGHG
jgi:hypothetical protein